MKKVLLGVITGLTLISLTACASKKEQIEKELQSNKWEIKTEKENIAFNGEFDKDGEFISSLGGFTTTHKYVLEEKDDQVILKITDEEDKDKKEEEKYKVEAENDKKIKLYPDNKYTKDNIGKVTMRAKSQKEE